MAGLRLSGVASPDGHWLYSIYARQDKGAFIHEAVAVLSGILRRMESHRYKKRSLFRKLEVSTFQHR